MVYHILYEHFIFDTLYESEFMKQNQPDLTAICTYFTMWLICTNSNDLHQTRP